MGFAREAPVGIEPTNRGFADLRLTTWLRRREGEVTPLPTAPSRCVYPDRRSPRVADPEPCSASGIATPLSRISRAHEAFRYRIETRGVGQLDGPLEELRLLFGRRRGAAARPGVGPEMMVVAAGAEEQRTRVLPHRAIEAEPLGEEGRRGGEVPHVQVHVAHHGAARQPRPGIRSRS